jgi:hypothetical protein
MNHTNSQRSGQTMNKGNRMTQLVKGFTNEELWKKAEYEGIDYLFRDYLSIDSIIDEDFKKVVQQFKLAFEEIQSTLDEFEPEEEEDEE